MNKQFYFDNAKRNYERYIANGVYDFLIDALNDYKHYKDLKGKKVINELEEYFQNV